MVTNLSGELREHHYRRAYKNHADKVEYLTIYVSDTLILQVPKSWLKAFEIQQKMLEETTEYDIEILKLHLNQAYPKIRIQDIKIFQDTKDIDYLQRKL